ncbi:hypothetical protein MMIC_P1004 [Mariprofundus micogutta]|uniref:DUF304 domain-containing protein n=1 Tax=Mariprofundus micogutta TaxID=1921010 RepID=A0A1L8CMA9_9PROT|nr:hypothetical protein [Mariprofundus micogutta]GAV20043.1 hypothetical protein MMIC_P1004 [Mariprofundus micogutta]
MYDHKAVVSAELDASETLLWSAQPRQGMFLRPSDSMMIPFSMLWGGFAIYWEFQVITGDAPLFFMLLGLPFVFIGLYLIIGRFFYDAKMREKTFYGITDKRVIILNGIRTKAVRSVAIEEITDMHVYEGPNGSGIIALAPEAISNLYQSDLMLPGQTESVPRLNHLLDVHRPYALIQQLRKNLPTRPD